MSGNAGLHKGPEKLNRGSRHRLLLFLGLALLVPWLWGVDYPIPMTNATATWQNQAGVSWSTNSTNGVIQAWERPLYAFVLATNGGRLHAGSNFTLTVRAVDDLGYHVTLTNVTNLALLSLDSNLGPSLSNLAVTNWPFLSPATPDFTGMTTQQLYPVAGKIFVSVPQASTTNFLDPGLLTFYPPPTAGVLTFDQNRYLGYGARALITLSDGDQNADAGLIETVLVRVTSTGDPVGRVLRLVETGPDTGLFTNAVGFAWPDTGQANRIAAFDSNLIVAAYDDPAPSNSILTNALFSAVRAIVLTNPYFVLPGSATNVRIWGVSADGYTNEVSSEYVVRAAELGATQPLRVLGSNEVGTLVSGLGNTLLSNVYSDSLSTNAVFLVTVRSNETARFDQGRFQLHAPIGTVNAERWLDLRPASNWARVYPVSNHSDAVLAAVSNLTPGQVLLDGFTCQVSMVDSNLALRSENFAAPAALTFTWSESDLSNGGSVRYGSGGFKAVALSSSNFWQELPAWASATNQLTVSATRPGVYALMAFASRQPSNAQSVAVYPNPFDFRKTSEAFILNLPTETTTVKIYAADATLVRTLGVSEIGYHELDGKIFRAARWDGMGRDGRPVRMGLYFVEVISSTGSTVRKLVVLR